MWFAIFFLIILFYFFIRPAYKVWKAVNSARNRARGMNDAFRRAAGMDSAGGQEPERKRASRKGGWTTPAPKRKKIDPGVGEYITFKEVEAGSPETTGMSGTAGSTGTAADNRERTAVAEQQVEDVKWEDVV